MRDVAVVEGLPLGLNNSRRRAWIDGYLGQPGEDLEVATTRVGPGYFETMRIPIVRGRSFSGGRKGAPLAVIVNEAFAARYWPGKEPLSQDQLSGPDGPRMEVVGVSRTGRYFTLGEEPRPFAHLPIEQRYEASVTVVARTSGDPQALLGPMRAEILGLGRDIPPSSRRRRWAAHLGWPCFPARLLGSVAGSFGLVALRSSPPSACTG